MTTNPPTLPTLPIPTLPPNLEDLRARLQRLGLYGLLANIESALNQPWLPQLLAIEEAERTRRSFKRRLEMRASESSSPSPTSTGSGRPSAIVRSWRKSSASASSRRPPTSYSSAPMVWARRC